MVMVDSFVTLLMLWVAVAFAKYLATEKLRDALLFGVIAGLAALTKGNGVAAVFIPPIAILVLRRWRLLLKPPLYCAAALVVIIAGPWQLMTARLLQNTVPFDQPGLAFTARMSAEYGRVLFHEAGPALLVLALIGLAMTLKSDFRRTADPLWTAFAAQLVAIWLFHSVVPVPGPEPRYMLAAMPAILLLAAAALRYLSELIPFTREPNRRLAFAGAAVALVLLGWTNLRIAERPDFGFRQVAATLHKDPNLADSVYMVASDAGGEGALIAEVAALDNPRPRHFVLRASKTLAEATWYNRNYQLLFPNPVKVTEFLDNTRTEVIVFDRSAPELPHSKLLMETIHSRPDQWKLASTVLKDRRLEVYRCERPPEKHREKLEIRMRYTLGRDIHE
jgi:4-amino-4-deoxy-L-arabinose transferase-like glycosyltransferase